MNEKQGEEMAINEGTSAISKEDVNKIIGIFPVPMALNNDGIGELLKEMKNMMRVEMKIWNNKIDEQNKRSEERFESAIKNFEKTLNLKIGENANKIEELKSECCKKDVELTCRIGKISEEMKEEIKDLKENQEVKYKEITNRIDDVENERITRSTINSCPQIQSIEVKSVHNFRTQFPNQFIKDIKLFSQYNRSRASLKESITSKLGGVLYQFNENGDKLPIAFYSKKLHEREKRIFTVTEKELYSIIIAVRKFRDTIAGYKLNIISDHQALCHPFACKNPPTRIQRWIVYLQGLNLAFKHVPGKNNQVADSLRRYVSHIRQFPVIKKIETYYMEHPPDTDNTDNNRVKTENGIKFIKLKMKNCHILVLLIYICIYLPAIFIRAEDCEAKFGIQSVCPTQDVPTHFSSCCWKNDTISCCPSSSYMDDSLVMMISIFVIFMCLLLSVLFVVCCFWSPCPLYSVCRMNYTYGDIVAYSKAEEALNLPPENIHKNNYTPLHINIKAVSED